MIKVAVIGTRGFPDIPGGIEKHCEQLYPRLVKLGCEVTVFTRRSYIPRERRGVEYKGVKFRHISAAKIKSLECIAHTLLAALKTVASKYDIVHVHGIGPSLLCPLLKIFGNKVIMTHHGPDYEREKWGYIARKILVLGERKGIKYSDAIISISRKINEHVKCRNGQNTVFIPNGVAIPAFVDPGRILDTFGLQPRKYILSVCRFVPEKGLQDLIAAYSMIPNPPAKLVIAGDADHETAFSRDLKKHASAIPDVILTGYVAGSELGELYSNSGLFVLPSHYEGLPIALLEALSYGLPVLVSNIAQHKEIPLSKFRFYEQGNIEQLSRTLTSVFLKGISKREKKMYKKLINSNYNWDTIAAETLKCYMKIMNEDNC